MCKGQIKSFRGCIYSFSWSHHLDGYGCGEQYATFITGTHVLHDIFRQLDRSSAIEVDHVEFGFQVSLGKKSAYADTCIYARHVNVPPKRRNLIPKLFNAFTCG